MKVEKLRAETEVNKRKGRRERREQREDICSIDNEKQCTVPF